MSVAKQNRDRGFLIRDIASIIANGGNLGKITELLLDKGVLKYSVADDDLGEDDRGGYQGSCLSDYEDDAVPTYKQPWDPTVEEMTEAEQEDMIAEAALGEAENEAAIAESNGFSGPAVENIEEDDYPF